MPLSGNLARMVTVNHLGLPRLPVPELRDTMQRYLRTAQPHMSEAAFAEHKKLVADFEEGLGKSLHEALMTREVMRQDEGGFPYFHFESYWDDGYLEARCPNPVNINPFYLLRRPVAGDRCPVSNAARFVHASAGWLLDAREGKVPDDGADVSQVPMFFGTARLPKKKRDVLEHYASSSSHVVALAGGRFYKVPIFTPEGKPRAAGALAADFAAALADAKSRPVEPSIAVLTAENRDKWAAARADLVQTSRENAEALAVVDSALLVVSLDVGDAGRDEGAVGQCRSALHGTATPNGTVSNRWYDKHSLIVDEGGMLAFNFEHSFADGGSWNKTFNELYARMAAAGTAPVTPEGESAVEPLVFELSGTTRAAVAAAEALVTKDFERGVDLTMLRHDAFGKKEIKKLGMSPDAFAQICFQAAYQQVHNKPAPTYEACAMRAFFHGRTETIRSCIPEVSNFASLFARGGTPKAELKAAALLAAAEQSKLAKEAAVGQGIDRHLLSLKMEAVHAGVDVAGVRLFKHPIFKHSGDWILSTSNVTNPCVDVFGFGAVTTNGYGLGYMTFDESLPMCITSFTNDKETSSRDMREALNQTLHRVREILL